MTSSLIVALLLTFLLLVAYYQSFKIPLVAMAAVPFGLVGIFPGHWLLDTTFSATSMIGIIALAGVVVRNALLIIDFVRDNLRAGMPLNDALCEAGAVRLKPIMLTTITNYVWLGGDDLRSSFRGPRNSINIWFLRFNDSHVNLYSPDL